MIEEVVSRKLLVFIARKISFDNLLPPESKAFQLSLKGT